MPRQATLPRLALVTLLSCALLLASGCGSGTSIAFEPDGGTYDDDALEALLDGYDLGDATEIATADAVEMRDDVLIELRRKGDEADGVADMLMRGFPLETPAVPVLVRGAVYDDADVWIVIEAWGDEEGSLEHGRAWVFDRGTGAVLWSASRR